MISFDFKKFTLKLSLPTAPANNSKQFIEKYGLGIVLILLTAISVYFFIYFYQNGLGLAYNDARSHLDIGRRVVEGLKP